MHTFSYTKVNNVAELLQRLQKQRGVIWAGGTDLMLKLKHGMARPEAVFDISRVEELCGIAVEGEYLHIGACAKLAEISKNEQVNIYAPLLARFIKEIGSMEIRNMGTIGGNICASRANCGVCFLPGCPAMTGDRSVPPCRSASYADTLLPLIAYDASVVIMSNSGKRNVKVCDFFKGNGVIDLKIGEVLVEVLLKKTDKLKTGVAELRQPEKMGFPFISVIAIRCTDSYKLTIGGSISKIHSFNNICLNDVNNICNDITFLNTLKFSKAYRRDVLPAVIREAINRAG